MSYKVIKNIKGNLYLYLQKSFRVNGRVKTESHYLGRVGGGTGTGSGGGSAGANTSPPNRPQEAREQGQAYQTPQTDEKATGSPHREQEAQGRKPAPVATTSGADPRPTPKQVATTRLKVKINLEKQSISENSLIATFENHIKILNGLGLDTNQIGQIKLKYSSVNETAPKHKKALLSSGYNVYLPAFSKGQRTKFWQEYRRAVAKTGLELIKTQNPAFYSNIKIVFNESYKRTNNLLSLYILNSADKNSVAKAIVIKWFGIYHGLFRNTMSTEDLGLTDKKRETWADEFSDLAGDIIHRGYSTVYKEWQERLHHALNNQKRASTARFNRETKKKWYNAFQIGYMDKANKEVMRAMARAKAQEEALEKIKIIGRLYNLQ